MKPQNAIALFIAGIGIGIILTALFISTDNYSTTNPALDSNSIQISFCPKDPCSENLISQLDAAQQTIDIAIYSFTLDEISDALIAAHERGVTVRVVFDKSQAASQYSEDERLAQAGIPLKIMQKNRGIMHNKFAVIDNQTVATGSYNYSQNATENNNENLIILHSPQIAEQYETEFEFLWNEN